MKKIFLTLGLALFAFAGAFAQETQTETKTDEPIENQEIEDATSDEYPAPEEGAIMEDDAAALQGKTKVSFEELPIAVQDAVTAAGIEQMDVVEAYKIEAGNDAQLEGEQTGDITASTEAKYEVHVDKGGETKVMTFDESGEKVKSKKDKGNKDKW